MPNAPLDLTALSRSRSCAWDRHALGKSAHGNLACAAGIRVVTGGRGSWLVCRLLDELVQFCQAASPAVSKWLHHAAEVDIMNFHKRSVHYCSLVGASQDLFHGKHPKSH